MKRSTATLATLVAAVVLAPAVAGYLEIGTLVLTRVVAVKWTKLPVDYLVTNRDVPGVTAPQLQAAAQQAFGTWAGVSTATLSSHFVGFTSADPMVEDSVSVIGFKSRPDLDRALAVTSFQVDSTTGALLGADILMNSIFDWSVAASGDPARYDAQSILTHEIGHLHGLGHSLIGETEVVPGGRRVIGKDTVMFPIAYPRGNILDRALKPDDVAGISDIYPNTSFLKLGQIQGRVTRNGAGVFGAHVTAFSPATGTLVGGFSLTADGRFIISGLPAGVYVVRVEPLDDADIESFFDDASLVTTNFTATYHEQLVAVPAGGASKPIEVKVTPK